MFEIEGYIKEFIENFSKINQEVTTNLAKQDLAQAERLKLQEYKTSLDQLQTSVVT